MASELRDTGISVVGNVPWGTHLCHFYEAKEDLLDTLIPYFQKGLENNEFCVWVVSDPFGEEEAGNAFRHAVPEADRYLAAGHIEIVHHTIFPSRQQTSPAGHIEIVPHSEWYLKGGAFIAEQVIDGWNEKLAEALAKGYAGLRANGNEAWLTDENRKDFIQYERMLDEKLAGQRMIVLCSYPLSSSSAAQIFDVVNTHQLAVIRRHGEWEVLETPELKRAKQEIQRLNEELEQRVIERTKELAAANEELKMEIAERKRAEALLHAKEHALKKSQRLLEEAQRIAHVGHYEHDLETGVIVASDENYRILGLQPQDSITLSRAFELIHPDDRARVNQERNEAVRTGQHFEVEFRMVRPDGQLRYIHSQGDVIRDEQGRPRRTFGIAQDITERKQAEAALRKSEEQLRLVIDTIPTMAWSLRPDGTVDFLNQRWMDYAGLTLEEYVKDPVGSIHPDDVPRVIERWLAQMALGEGYEDEMRLRRADGEYRWFLVRTEPFHDEQGNVIKWYGSSIDIEDRKEAEEKLKHSEVQLAQAQRVAHVGSWDWDLRTGKVTWSDELYRIYGLPPRTIKAAGDAMRFIHPDDRDLVWRTVKDAVAKKERYSFHYRVLRPDGTERIVHSRGSVLTDEQGEPIRVFGATQDVTELKRAEEKLKETSAQLRALSASLQSAREEESKRIAREIHDELGGALTTWKWDLEEIRDIVSEPVDPSQVTTLRTKIEAMIKLTETTLDMVRRLASELRPMALELGLAEAIEWQSLQFENRTGIAVTLEFPPNKIDLNDDRSTAVYRILQEALTNIQRHAQATKVTITAREELGQFILTIKDNGRGITETEESAGQSLGLIGMRERAYLVGGDINIESIEGDGTKITVQVAARERVEDVPESND